MTVTTFQPHDDLLQQVKFCFSICETEAQKAKDLTQLSMRKRFQPKVSSLGAVHH